MHVLGKVLAIFVLFAAGAAAVLTSKLVVVRNSWTAKAATYKARYNTTLRPQVDELETKIDRLKNDLSRAKDLWGKSWNGVRTDLGNAADGSLNLNIGLESELHQGLVLHGFELDADGKSIYRGSFLVTEVANGNSVVKPNWRITPDEVSKWQMGNWRWRNTIPSGYQENFDRHLSTILRYEETLADRRQTLASQGVLLNQANDGLKLREAELVGGDMLAQATSVDPEYREGLVSAVEQTEEERNKSLRQIDELRRKVRAVQADIDRLNAENSDLVQRLPEPGPVKKLSQKK